MSDFLLPRSHQEFGSADYWDKFFKHRGAKAFEWYGEYQELCGLLHKYIKVKDNLLVIGCGNSMLSSDLYDVGYHEITNIDVSDAVIKQMNERNNEKRPDMKFLKMDMLQMDFKDGEFSVVLDKGTLDAVMTDDSQEVRQKIDLMFAEIARVLRVGGRYVCITLAQTHILCRVLQYFTEEGWMVRVCPVPNTAKSATESHLPVFAFVFTKFKKMPNMKQILEVAYFEEQVERLGTREELADAVLEIQRYELIKHQLGKGSVSGEHISLDLYSPTSKSPRYTIHVVDASIKCAKKYGVFIVPEGRETDWLFGTAEGRNELLQRAGCDRLAVVTLHRDHTYSSLDEVKGELSAKVMELAPAAMVNKQVPYLTIGSDLCVRTTHLRSKSDVSGEYVVEDVAMDGETVRRLIFLDTRSTVQSEARLLKEVSKRKGGKRKTKLVVDLNHLSHGYYRTVVAGLALLEDCGKSLDSGLDLLLVGLGGGGLAMYIHNTFQNIRTTVVELDPTIVQVAKNWFGYAEDERLTTHVADGLQYIRDLAKEGSRKYQVVILDVDSKDRSLGLSCPPKPFVEPEFLDCVSAIVDAKGVFILNLVCWSQSLKKSVISDLKAAFQHVCARRIPDDVNDIIFAQHCSQQIELGGAVEDALPKELQGAVNALAEAAKLTNSQREEDDLCDALTGLRVL